MSQNLVTLIEGDGIGPEITDAVVKIIHESQNYLNKNNVKEDSIEFEKVVVGEKLYNQNISCGIDEKAWEIIRKNKVMLKAPITTPTGGGYKSLNVTIRKTLKLFANVRPSVSYYPIIQNSPKEMDLVVIRENEEDLYSGIEYRQTNNSFTSLKLLTKEGSLKICHFAFEYARVNGRKKVTCMIKDNIMKITDGMFYDAFLEVSKHYPDIIAERYIIDIGSARIAARPGVFDVIVTENLYGDIISDIASEISGSVGLAGSANIGEEYAMFEAIHGSAPLMAGKQTANPSAFLNGAILMLKHMGMTKKANLIEDAFWKTLEDGVHTKDIFKEESSKKKVGTMEFADEIIKRFGQKCERLSYVANNISEDSKMKKFDPSLYSEFLFENKLHKHLVGFDFFVDMKSISPNEIALMINDFIKNNNFDKKVFLSSIMVKGLKVWPGAENQEEKDNIFDFWMLRFMIDESLSMNSIHNNLLLISGFYSKLICEKGLDIVKVENLYNFESRKVQSDEVKLSQGFSAGQGE